MMKLHRRLLHRLLENGAYLSREIDAGEKLVHIVIEWALRDCLALLERGACERAKCFGGRISLVYNLADLC